jgi:hypothetical protein
VTGSAPVRGPPRHACGTRFEDGRSRALKPICCRTRTRAPSACGQRNLRLLSLSAISPPHVNLAYLSTLPERKRLVVHQTPVTGKNSPRSVTWRGGEVVRLQRLHAVKRGVAAASEGQPGARVNRPRHPLDQRRRGPSGDEKRAEGSGNRRSRIVTGRDLRLLHGPALLSGFCQPGMSVAEGRLVHRCRGRTSGETWWPLGPPLAIGYDILRVRLAERVGFELPS